MTKQVVKFHVHYEYGYYNDKYSFVHHREDGPAFIGEYGESEKWYIHGQCITNEVEEWLDYRGIEDYKDMTEEDKMALTFFMQSCII